MELLQLRYFCKVAQCGSITRAADEFHVSQPSISKTIALLEKEVGMQLFDRLGRGIQLNQHGAKFYKHAIAIVNHVDDSLQELKDTTEEPSGKIRLLILAASNLMPDLFINFYKIYPKINLQLVRRDKDESLLSNDWDLCISATPSHYPELESTLLLKEDLVLAVPSDHPLAKRKSIHLSEAADYKFISYTKGASIRTLSDSICHFSGFQPNIVFESDSVQTVKVMLQNKVGIALIPSITQRSILSSTIIPVAIEKPESHREINLSWRGNRYMSNATKTFKDYTIQLFKTINNQIP
ncbi:LysR family transcriptional regulator [Paenibacillus sp. 2TAB23]|uniref:LysR family transcriptional regulator n=1 Tax=Paenibacillus sp. 2TAB23 TaxID=3233004 RepID=UPI003F987B10